MAVSQAPAPAPGGEAKAAHERGYHALRIAAVIPETSDASSIVFDVPTDKQEAFTYQAGQFLTFRLTIDGQQIYRSYSMSSAPEVDGAMAVTVKRVLAGVGSNWLLDNLTAGDTVDSSVPAGVFRLGAEPRDIVAFAAGSGITPIMSLVKSALATSDRSVRLLYANRDAESVIFASTLANLVAAHPDRLEVVDHLDDAAGFVDASRVEPYVESARTADCFICGPGPFMDIVETALLNSGVPADQIHIERFLVTEPAPTVVEDAVPVTAAATQVTIELDGQTKSAAHHPGTTILQTARSMGMQPPFSCEAGNCATCMAKLLDGEVKMHVNDALYDDEVADGWILTCQSVPTTPTVHVVYGYEES